MDYRPPGSSVVGFSRQKYWSGLPFPSPGDLPNPGIERASPALAGRFFTIWATREAPQVMLIYGQVDCLSHGDWTRVLIKKKKSHIKSNQKEVNNGFEDLLKSAHFK